MPTEQTFKNHAMYDPAFHFFMVPVFLANIILAIYITVRDWPLHSRSHLWWIVMSIALFILLGTVRRYAAGNQDRIIRLEERIRYSAVLSPAVLARTSALTIKQIVALRFASDEELPALLDRTLTGNLTPKAIKQNIVTWRPDYQRT